MFRASSSSFWLYSSLAFLRSSKSFCSSCSGSTSSSSSYHSSSSSSSISMHSSSPSIWTSLDAWSPSFVFVSFSFTSWSSFDTFPWMSPRFTKGLKWGINWWFPHVPSPSGDFLFSFQCRHPATRKEKDPNSEWPVGMSSKTALIKVFSWWIGPSFRLTESKDFLRIWDSTITNPAQGLPFGALR